MKVRIEGAEDVRAMIRKYLEKLGDLSVPFADFGEYKLRALREQWDREEDPYGNWWKELSPATVAEKEREKKLPYILTREGTLRGSFTYRESPKTLSIGTNMKYAPKHQLGVGVPKREMLGMNDADFKELLDTFVSYLPAK